MWYNNYVSRDQEKGLVLQCVFYSPYIPVFIDDYRLNWHRGNQAKIVHRAKIAYQANIGNQAV